MLANNNTEHLSHKILNLEGYSNKKLRLDKLAIYERNKISFINYTDILFCKSEGNYTHIYLRDNTKITVSKCLKVIADSIKDKFFFRVHASYFVNMRFLEELRKGDNLSMVIQGNEIPVSRSRSNAVMDLI